MKLGTKSPCVKNSAIHFASAIDMSYEQLQYRALVGLGVFEIQPPWPREHAQASHSKLHMAADSLAASPSIGCAVAAYRC